MWFRSLLDSLTSLLSHSPARSQSPGPARRRAAAARLQFEALENRSLMTANVLSDFGSQPMALSEVDSSAGQAARAVTVMVRNLYLGADLSPVLGALSTGDPDTIINAASTAWAGVLSTNFPERAEALADEIAHAQPLLVGLQEVSLFRTGTPDSFFGNPTRADQVEFDYLEILLRELDERGLHYSPVALTQNSDAETTGFVAPGVLRDIRHTDRDVILARTDLPASTVKMSNPQTGNFATNLTIPIGATGQFFTNLHGWGSVDVMVRGQTFRFINTHLEVESPNPIVNAIQVAQANELLIGPAGTSLPVILVGDFNSRADGTGTQTYSLLAAASFNDAWSDARPGELGLTFGHDADLRNTTIQFTKRIDLVLYRGDLQAFDADVVGEELADRTPSGLWPSDHAGVVATLGIHIRPLRLGAKSHAVPDLERPLAEVRGWPATKERRMDLLMVMEPTIELFLWRQHDEPRLLQDALTTGSRRTHTPFGTDDLLIDAFVLCPADEEASGIGNGL